ncbi:MAG: hypothetical protein IJ508_04675 [Oscillospiraceae bacterium]|nr:hypothetical protein [Oscillospiraceae bacterium]MBQ9109372.1 hypothetical protein [Oscillospiraceae bacterium]
MTVNELLSAAAALFFETDTSAYDEVALPFVNMLLAECFEANNRILRKAGRQELAHVPVLTGLTDTIPYEEGLVRLAMPYGLAAKLYFEEQDSPRMNYFLSEYADRVNRCDRWVVAL